MVRLFAIDPSLLGQSKSSLGLHLLGVLASLMVANGALKCMMKQPWKPLGIFLSPCAAQFMTAWVLSTLTRELWLKVLTIMFDLLSLGKAKCTTVVCLAGVTLVWTLRLVRQIPQQQGPVILVRREH